MQTLTAVMDNFNSTDEVRAWEPFMGKPLNIQLKYPIQKCTVSNGRMVASGEFVPCFTGVIQPSELPDRVLIAALEMGIGIVAKPSDIEAVYVALMLPEPEQKPLIRL